MGILKYPQNASSQKTAPSFCSNDLNSQRETKFSNFRSTVTAEGFRQMEPHTEKLSYPLQDAYSIKDKDESQL